MTESTIFPSPPEPDSVLVAPGKAYWIRYKHDGLAVVRLANNVRAEERTGMDGAKSTAIVYDETEFELTDRPELGEFIRANYDTLWQMYEPCRFTEYNPVVR
jgi:hypothetical protein